MIKFATLSLIALAVTLCGCATVDLTEPPVRKVDFSKAPEAREFGDEARRVGNEFYPEVLQLLADKRSNPPRRFEIVFKRLKSGNNGETDVRRAKIYVNADYLRHDSADQSWKANTLTNLQMLLIHEMVHLTQRYRYEKAPAYWSEGIADYARYKLGYTNGWACPQCAVEYPHYTSGYWCAGAFLLFIDARYGSDLVRALNGELGRGSYSLDFFAKATGKSLEDLWREFQSTPAYKPIATEVYALHQTLGYVNGKSPKDITARAVAYLRQKAGGRFTEEAGEFLKQMILKHQLPGIVSVHSSGHLGIDALDMVREAENQTFPLTRTFFCKQNGDPSRYHYIVVRQSKDEPWKLQKAWRTDPADRVIEEYAIRSN
jgi:hypothetical protein